MQERFIGEVKGILGKFVDLRSNQEIIAAKGKAENEFRESVQQYASGQIPLTEFRQRFEAYCKNPDTVFNLRKMADKLSMP